MDLFLKIKLRKGVSTMCGMRGVGDSRGRRGGVVLVIPREAGAGCSDLSLDKICSVILNL